MNLRPSGYEPDELPGCSTPRYQRKPEGFIALPAQIAMRFVASSKPLCGLRHPRKPLCGLSCVPLAPYFEGKGRTACFSEATKAAVERPIVTRPGRLCDEKIGLLEQTPWVCSKVAFGRPGSDLLSRVLRRSTMGAGAFHGRVRKGNGCSHPAITTRSAKRNFN